MNAYVTYALANEMRQMFASGLNPTIISRKTGRGIQTVRRHLVGMTQGGEFTPTWLPNKKPRVRVIKFTEAQIRIAVEVLERKK